jgi:polysaccharide pyruvyl transferase WcaK-like protein
LGVPIEAMSYTRQESSPAQVAATVACSDLVVSMRLHALIFAARRGVPVLALAYARKMRGVMKMLRAEHWVVEVEARNPPPEELEMKLRQLWPQRREVGAALRNTSNRAVANAEADADHISSLLVSS